MLTPLMGNRHPRDGRPWAADNGCFAQPLRFDLTRYLAWLEERTPRGCLFATAPDVVGDAVATWERSRNVLPLLRQRGFRAALVAQDGIQATAIQWDAFDCLFIGGSTAWKLSEPTYVLIGEAKERGKWVHCGRVNSERRYRAMEQAGCDSVDGTYLAFGPDVNSVALRRWVASDQRPLPLWEVAS